MWPDFDRATKCPIGTAVLVMSLKEELNGGPAGQADTADRR
jgi:hypothetical protein